VEILVENILVSQHSYVVWLGEDRGMPRGKKNVQVFWGENSYCVLGVMSFFVELLCIFLIFLMMFQI
jgi:hypothetical protein